MKQVILTRGLPASGKSTWAKAQLEKHPNQYKRVNKDDLRAMLDGGRWSRDNEDLVLRVRDRLILMALENGKHVIVDDTNLHLKHERHIRELVKGYAEVVIQDFTYVPLEECIRRDLQRPASVGEKVIRDMWKQFLRPAPNVYVPPENGIPAIICDLDGTLALMNGRSPYDASTCDQDLLCQEVAAILDKRDRAYQIIFVSGRMDKYREQTERWLHRHHFYTYKLFMRKTGDTRKDWIIKQEIFDQHIRDTYRVLFVLDDRNRVVDMWRSLGLKCLQVAEGDF